jgi:hypothetical protein
MASLSAVVVIVTGRAGSTLIVYVSVSLAPVWSTPRIVNVNVPRAHPAKRPR